MPRKREDLTGKVFGRLTVIGFSHSAENDHDGIWNCVCSCDPNKIVQKRGQCLKKKKYPSCGCWYYEIRRVYNEYNLSGDFGIGYIGEKEFYFDLEDYDLIKDYAWCLREWNYVVTRTTGKMVRLHRLIMGFPEGLVVDHIDRNPLNNRKNNLRSVTNRENSQNITKYKNKTSKYVGVYYDKRAGKWSSRIHGLHGERINLGYYFTEEEAGKSYNKLAKELGYLTRNEVEE